MLFLFHRLSSSLHLGVYSNVFSPEKLSQTHTTPTTNYNFPYCCPSVAKLCPTLRPCGLKHARLLCPSLSPKVCSDSCPLSWWFHPTITWSVAFFSSCPQSFPTSWSFPMSWLFASGSQSVGASASAWVLLMNIQDRFPLRLTGLMSLLSKGLLRVFSSTAIWKHQFFGA